MAGVRSCTFEDGCRPRTHGRQRHRAEHPKDYCESNAAVAFIHGARERQLRSSRHNVSGLECRHRGRLVPPDVQSWHLSLLRADSADKTTKHVGHWVRPVHTRCTQRAHQQAGEDDADPGGTQEHDSADEAAPARRVLADHQHVDHVQRRRQAHPLVVQRPERAASPWLHRRGRRTTYMP